MIISVNAIHLCGWHGANDSGPQAQTVEELPTADDSRGLTRLLQKRRPKMQGQLTVYMHVLLIFELILYMMMHKCIIVVL